MTRHRRLSAFSAGFAALALIVAACGGDDSDSDDNTTETSAAASDTTAGGTTETTAGGTAGGTEEVPAGGTLIIGAEQQGDCLDWIGACSGTSWMYWSVGAQTMPRVWDTVKQGDEWVPVPSILVTGEPELVTEPKQVVTYKINPDAVWSDGTPITSTDFKYTWEQVANGTDIYDKTGYRDVESVDDTDPKTAVVTFSKPYAGWRVLFAGNYGVFPSHLLEGKDRNAEMANGYTWSGGPWKLESWNKDVDWTLVPNENYWGEKPKLDKVVFRFISDTSAEFQAFQAGEVQAIYPQPQPDVIQAINAGDLNGEFVSSEVTGNFEVLWLNNSKAPFDSVAVRQAFAYSLDRQEIVQALFGGIVTEPLQTLNSPILAFYSDTDAFAGYTLDLEKVDELMTGDGWTKNGSGIWEKGGQTASVTFTTTANNARRLLTQQVVQEQAREAGFEIELLQLPAGEFFGQRLPTGDFEIGLYAQVATFVDPSTCVLFCSANIPSEANGNAGNNYTRTSIPEVDELLLAADAELDPAARAEKNSQAETILAEQAASIPLDPLPNLLLWSDQVLGPVSDNPVLGPWWNLNELGVAS